MDKMGKIHHDKHAYYLVRNWTSKESANDRWQEQSIRDKSIAANLNARSNRKEFVRQ